MAMTITADRLILRRPDSILVKAVPLMFAIVLMFVGGVSAYDGYLVVRTGDDIRDFERNPVGLCLINYNYGDPSLFLMAKAAGTIVVLAALIVMYRRSQRMAMPVAFALALFQSGLLIFLQHA